MGLLTSTRSVNVPYLAPIDHLRAIAALMVVGYHALHFSQTTPSLPLHVDGWQKFSNPLLLVLYEGYAGVSLFFVISGFLFTYAADRNGEFRKGAFWWNRFVRIYPMFFFMVFLAVASGLAGSDLRPVALTLLLLGNLPGGTIDTAYTLPLWTIAVESQFYVIFPFLLWRYRQNGPAAIIALIALIVGARLLTSYIGPAHDIHATLLGRLDQFMLGMLAAVFCRRHVLGSWQAATGLVVALALLSGLLAYYNANGPMVGQITPNRVRFMLPTIEGAIWAALLVSYLRIGAMLPIAVSSAIAWVGTRSYSMYLLNVVAVDLCIYRGWLLLTESWLVSALSLAAMAAVVLVGMSAVTYALIELPFMQLRRSYFVAAPTAAEKERHLRVV